MSPFLYRAGNYIRQSKKREGGSEASPSTQRSANLARINQMGATLFRNYEDLGISAFNGDERPEFERLLADCRAGHVNLIVVYYISRLSRLDPLDAIPVVSELLNLGVTIVSVTEGEFRKGNMMDLIHLIMRLDAAYRESKNKSEHIRGAKAVARELGGYVSGKPPFGFKLRPEIRTNAEGRPIKVQLLERDPEEAAVVQFMTRRILDREKPASAHSLAAELNAGGIPTRGARLGKAQADSVWRHRTLYRILRDPRLAGYDAEVIYTTRPDGTPGRHVAGYRIVRDEDGVPVMTNPEIISPEDFFAMQTRLADIGRTAPYAPAAPSLLSALNLLHCECGSRMSAHKNLERAYNSAYLCTRPYGVAVGHEGSCTVSQRALDNYIARRIFALIATADDDAETLQILTEATRRFGLHSADPATLAQRGALAGELDDAERALETLYDDRNRGGYSGKVGQRKFLEQERALSARIDTLTAQVEEIDANASPMLPIGEWLGDPGQDPIGPGSWWNSAPLNERRALITLFIQKIVIRKATSTRPAIEDRVAAIEWVRPEPPE
ncbi:recombinase family protein [Actinoplanes philippinensis]|uniref:recombinase family protein n=1 Tax=Actinoplanes philippinensis TaxID=35752 RepID=UPI0033F233E6